MHSNPHDTSELDEHAAEAKKAWGKTPQWAEYERKWAGKSKADEAAMGELLMELFKPFGRMAAEGAGPACEEAQAQVVAVQDYISKNVYTCTDEILASLGLMYGSGGDFTRNINDACGPGAAEFAAAAIAIHCERS